MANAIDNHWSIRLADAAKALEKNNFEAHVVQGGDDARELVLGTLLPALVEAHPAHGEPFRISYGGMATLAECGLHAALLELPGVEVLDTWAPGLTPEEKNELRRRALLVDLFFTSTNALTMDGTLVNLDMIGNRVGALGFGPRHVVVIAGRNKLVADRDAAVARIKEYAAPVNATRLNKKTPCVKAGRCMDCKSPERICNVWTVHEKSFPAGRVKVVLVNEDLGF
jgi:hypothetical protein